MPGPPEPSPQPPPRPRSLPGRPSLRHLKLEAKRRLAAGEFAALHDAQVAIAREHGLPTWAALKQSVCEASDAADSHALDPETVCSQRRKAGSAAGSGRPAVSTGITEVDGHPASLSSARSNSDTAIPSVEPGATKASSSRQAVWIWVIPRFHGAKNRGGVTLW